MLHARRPPPPVPCIAPRLEQIWAALYGLLPRSYLHPYSNVGGHKPAALTRLRIVFGKTYIDDVAFEMDRQVATRAPLYF